MLTAGFGQPLKERRPKERLMRVLLFHEGLRDSAGSRASTATKGHKLHFLMCKERFAISLTFVDSTGVR